MIKLNFIKNVNLKDMLNFADDSDTGNFFYCDSSYPDNIEEKTKNFPSCLGKKVSLQDNFIDFLNEIKPIIYTHKNLICDSSDKKYYLFH